MSSLTRNLSRQRSLLLIMLLPFTYYVIFHYLPMYGAIIAFKDFSIQKGILGSEWVGFKWFYAFFESPYFGRTVINTFLLNFYDLIFGFPVPILFALLINEIKHAVLKKTVQTVSYLPYFISVVIVVGMMVNFLSPNDGIVNVILEKLGHQPINFMSDPGWFRTLFVASGIWQTFGFYAVIYIAAIAAIDPSMYEAATLDGAGRLHKIIHITLPSIRPTIIILLLLNLGNMLNIGFEKVILMYSPAVYSTGDVIMSYVYRRGITNAEYSFAAAVGLFNSVVGLILIVGFNKFARKFSETSLW
jgi:putative aldouronate transport system permease protein